MVGSRKRKEQANLLNLEKDLDKALNSADGLWAAKLGKVKEEWQRKHADFKFKLAHMETLEKELAVVDAAVHRLETRLSYRRKRLRELTAEVASLKDDYSAKAAGVKRKFPIMLSSELKTKRGEFYEVIIGTI